MFHVERVKSIAMNLKNLIREIPDWPKPGINFKDITILLRDKDAFHYVVDDISAFYKDKQITKIVTLESRGFIIGGAIAYQLNAGFIPIRKKNKLPCETCQETYALEYGTDQVEMHTDALDEDDVVLIHDDLLATGGTAMAALNLVRKMGVKNIYFSFLIDLSFIQNSIKQQIFTYPVHTLISY